MAAGSTSSLDLAKAKECIPKSIDDDDQNIEVSDLYDDDDNKEEIEDFVSAFQIAQSCALPMVLKAAVELDLFGIMARASSGHYLSSKEIAGQLPTHNPDAPSMLDRMLRFLATHSVVRCSVDPTIDGESERRYGLAPISEFYVSDKDGASLAPLLTMVLQDAFHASWSKLKDAVLRGGIPFNMMHGVHAFEYTGLNPSFNEVFNKAMFNHPSIIINKILQKYKGFAGICRLVDVGGGLGHNLRAITSHYHPSIRGVNFDLPHVIRNALPYPGVEHVGGDMFESIPDGDAIFMKWILHDWSDEECLKLLKNCYKALPDNGKVIVVESVMKEKPGTSNLDKTISQMDMYMLTQSPGGKERIHTQFLALAVASGFSGINVCCRVGHFWVMEFYK